MRWPEPTMDPPTAETLQAWAEEDRGQATDGCWLSAGESTCAHGHPSWVLVLEVEIDSAR